MMLDLRQYVAIYTVAIFLTSSDQTLHYICKCIRITFFPEFICVVLGSCFGRLSWVWTHLFKQCRHTCSNSADLVKLVLGVCTVCQSLGIFWAHFCMIKLDDSYNNYFRFQVLRGFLTVFFLRYIWAVSWQNLLYHMRPRKAQISLSVHAVWSAPLLFTA